jgi:hypothetical protein
LDPMAMYARLFVKLSGATQVSWKALAVVKVFRFVSGLGDVEEFRQGVEVFGPGGGRLGLDHIVEVRHLDRDMPDAMWVGAR